MLGDGAYEPLLGLDLGDIVGVDGTAFKTRRGELSLRGHRLDAARQEPAPAARQVPRPRGRRDSATASRELDLIANPETRELFRKRGPDDRRDPPSGSTREGFVEVETPVLQPLYGGALARPFTTHHNALDRDLYLRIATELYLKR